MRSFSHLLLATALATGGCASGPGGPFATVDGVIASEYAVPLDRALPDGWAKLATDYQLRITSARIGVVDAELRARTGGGGGSGATFDPANPPPGYSLCHAGHCHRDDGALVPYEDIQAELDAGGPTLNTIVRFPVGAELQALPGEERPLQCEGSCDLGLITLTEIRSTVSLLSLEGLVRDLRAPPRISGEVPFVLFADRAVLRTGVRILADRSHPPHIALRIRVEPSPEHFDALDWGALARSAGVINFSLPANEESLDEVVDAFASSAMAVDVQRSE
jgi:hypothetical protein